MSMRDYGDPVNRSLFSKAVRFTDIGAHTSVRPATKMAEQNENIWIRPVATRRRFACHEPGSIIEQWNKGVIIAMEMIDLNVLRQLEEDTSRELLPKMIAVFREETLDRVDRMRTASESSDFVAIASEAHAIKSGAGTFGASELQALAKTVEQASRDGNYEVALSKVAELETVAQLSLNMLAQYTESDRDSS